MGVGDELTNTVIAHVKDANAANSLSTPPVGATPSSRASPAPSTSNRKQWHSYQQNNGANVLGKPNQGGTRADGIDPDQLKGALEKFEDAGRRRDVTPGGSPSRKRQRVYGDRYVNDLDLCND